MVVNAAVQGIEIGHTIGPDPDNLSVEDRCAVDPGALLDGRTHRDGRDEQPNYSGMTGLRVSLPYDLRTFQWS